MFVCFRGSSTRNDGLELSGSIQKRLHPVNSGPLIYQVYILVIFGTFQACITILVSWFVSVGFILIEFAVVNIVLAINFNYQHVLQM